MRPRSGDHLGRSPEAPRAKDGALTLQETVGQEDPGEIAPHRDAAAAREPKTKGDRVWSLPQSLQRSQDTSEKRWVRRLQGVRPPARLPPTGAGQNTEAPFGVAVSKGLLIPEWVPPQSPYFNEAFLSLPKIS